MMTLSSHLRGSLRSQKLKQGSKRGRCTVLLRPFASKCFQRPFIDQTDRVCTVYMEEIFSRKNNPPVDFNKWETLNAVNQLLLMMINFSRSRSHRVGVEKEIVQWERMD